ncbi:MAG: DUF4469 domain-containing protein [Angelakisella sp.]
MLKQSQRAKLTLKALLNLLTKDVKNDYYFTVKTQKSLSLNDLAQEVASSHGHQNASEVEMLTRETLELAAWYLSNGYTVTTPLGYFHTTVSGTLLDSELNSAPDRSRLKLGVGYSMSDTMRQALAEAELGVEIDTAKAGPQLYAVVSGHDAQRPDASTRGESVPVSGGEQCILKGKNLKVGGPEAGKPGITLTRVDTTGTTPVFIPAAKLYPNTSMQVGFVMPASATKGSVWQISLCTQITSTGSKLLKEPRTVVMDNTFVVGETTSSGDGGGGTGGDGNPDENPLG